MNRKELVSQIFSKKSFLCVGLDTDIRKIPEFLLKEDDPVFAFNKAQRHHSAWRTSRTWLSMRRWV